jgi:hypothetical protein
VSKYHIYFFSLNFVKISYYPLFIYEYESNICWEHHSDCILCLLHSLLGSVESGAEILFGTCYKHMPLHDIKWTATLYEQLIT